MQTYEELLLTPEWRTKRAKIIHRDNNKCRFCNNLSILAETSIGLCLPEHEKTKISNGYELYLNNFYDNSKINIVLLFGFENLEDKEEYVFYYSKTSTENSHYNVVVGVVKMHLTDENRSSYLLIKSCCEIIKFEQSNIPFLKNSFLEKAEWVYIKGLHCHHKYYQENLKPWEYPDDALETLCWACHEKLHANTLIPVLDSKGNNIGNLTPCKRCFGIGYFPEFRNVENGICFRCRGYRFEELMKI